MDHVEMQTVADLLAKTLREVGVEIVFGLPGGENAEVLDAIRRQGIEFVLVHNENSAVFMADAYARLTGKIGVCLVTLGPGATNATAGIAHAYLDRSPILILTAQSMERLLGSHTHQVLDLQALYRPITKLTAGLTSIDTLATIQQALYLATTGRPGPVHLGISSEMSVQLVEQIGQFIPAVVEEERIADQTSMAVARTLLTRAKRPILVVGLGLEPERPYDALLRFVEAHLIPVIVTPKAKGCIPEDHPLFIGTIGLTTTDPAYEMLDEADYILAVGFDVVELVKPWDQAQPLIWIANWGNEDPTIAAELELIGSIKSVLEQLTQVAFEIDESWGERRVAMHRQRLREQALPVPASARLLPQTMARILRENIPRDTLIATDVGSHKIFMALNWQAYAPNRYLVSNGLSAMGYALPAAIVASMVLEETVVCVMGDGGFAMISGELGLLLEYRLPVIVVVMNDAALDLIRSAQLRRGKEVCGTEFSNPDFEMIACAYSLDYYRVTDEASGKDTFREAISTQRPALIEVLVDPVGYPTTPR